MYLYGFLLLKKKFWVNVKNFNEVRLLVVDFILDSFFKIKGKNL